MGFIQGMDGPDIDCQPTHVVIEWGSGAFAPQDELFQFYQGPKILDPRC